MHCLLNLEKEVRKNALDELCCSRESAVVEYAGVIIATVCFSHSFVVISGSRGINQQLQLCHYSCKMDRNMVVLLFALAYNVL